MNFARSKKPAAIYPDRLAGALAKGLPPLTWIHGDEPLIVIECADQVRTAARAAGYAERIVLDVNSAFTNADWQSEAASQSLFGDCKLIEIRAAGKPRRDLVEALAQWLTSAPDDVRILITSQRPDRNLLQGREFSQLGELGVVVQVFPIAFGDLPGWLARRLSAQGQRADKRLLNLLANRVEGNLIAARQEVLKLALLFPKGDLDFDAAAAVVLDVTRFAGGDLVDAALAGDLARLTRCVAGLRAAGQADVMVIWHLTDVTRLLLRLAEARETGQATAGSVPIRGPLPRVKLIERATGRVDTGRARRALAECAEADTIAKGFNVGESWALIERIAWRLAGHEPLARPADPIAL